MSRNVSDNLVLELLRAMRSDLTTVREDMREVKLRLTALETAVGNLARQGSAFARPRSV